MENTSGGLLQSPFKTFFNSVPLAIMFCQIKKYANVKKSLLLTKGTRTPIAVTQLALSHYGTT